MGQFVPKGQESRRHRQGLHWTEEDTKAVEQYKKDLAAGKIKVIDITRMNAKDMLNAPDNAFFCGNCECFDQADGDRKACECPCHKPGGCNN